MIDENPGQYCGDANQKDGEVTGFMRFGTLENGMRGLVEINHQHPSKNDETLELLTSAAPAMIRIESL